MLVSAIQMGVMANKITVEIVPGIEMAACIANLLRALLQGTPEVYTRQNNCPLLSGLLIDSNDR